MMRVFIWGAYKSPRQLTWLLGTFLFLLTMSMMFAGAPLPWDEKGYWATEVGTSIAGTVPLIGTWLQRLLRGGDAMGQLTISRFFVLHVAILPGLLASFIVLHLVSFRRVGSVGPWQEAQRKRKGVFWPDQVYKDLIMAGSVFIILLALCVFLQPPFAGPADPLDSSYTPKPEWNFLFLYQALKLFPGRLEVVGTVGVPLLIALLLLGVPFIDRRAERNPARRPLAMASLFLVIAIVVALSLTGNASRPGANLASKTSATQALTSTPASSPGEGPQLFQTLGCLACHTFGGTGGKVGPDLSSEGTRGRSREWLVEQILNPKSHFADTVMPSFSNLKKSQVDSLVEYLLGLKSAGPAPVQTAEAVPAAAAGEAPQKPEAAGQGTGINLSQEFIGSSSRGAELFVLNCQACHGANGTDKVPNPGSQDGTVPSLNPIDRDLFDKDPVGFIRKIDPFLQNGSTPEGPNPALRMPAFGKTLALSQEQISNLEAYILRLNGVERAEIFHPGIRPLWFFILVAAVFGAATVLFIGVWLARRARSGRHHLSLSA
jgi:ubiquinol-cytochrome c reductase cytochrome b subunit